MAIKYGVITTTTNLGGDIQMSEVDLIYQGTKSSSFKQYKVRHIVSGPQDAVAIALKFLADLKSKRDSGKLVTFKEDSCPEPSLTFRFPEKNNDGRHMIITSWTEKI